MKEYVLVSPVKMQDYHGSFPARFVLLADARAQIEALQGALASQDARERAAGEKCGVDYAMWGCDWPDGAAETIVGLRSRLALMQEECERATKKAEKNADIKFKRINSLEQHLDAAYEALGVSKFSSRSIAAYIHDINDRLLVEQIHAEAISRQRDCLLEMAKEQDAKFADLNAKLNAALEAKND